MSEYSAEYSAIAIAVRPQNFIADIVLPRYASGTKAFEYVVDETGDAFRLDDVEMGRTSRANQIEAVGQTKTARVRDRGLEAVTPVDEIDEAMSSRSPWDPEPRNVEIVAARMHLAREEKARDLYQDDANFATTRVLAGNSQWSDFTNSDPLANIQDAIDGMLLPPTHLVCSEAVWSKLRRHPRIVRAVRGTDADEGIIAQESFEQLFELRLARGRVWSNTARRGRDPVYARLWGAHAALVHISAQMARVEDRMPTWGFCGTWGDAYAVYRYDDDARGIKGSRIARITDQSVEVAAVKALGYRFRDAIA